MNQKIVSLSVVLALTIAFLAACGGDSAAPQDVNTPTTIDQISASVNQTVAAIAVAETVTALTGSKAATPEPPQTTSPADAAPATDSPTSEPPTAELPTEEPPTAPPPDVVNDAPAAATEPPPTAEPVPSCTTITGVNLRGGPGAAYEPPIGTLAANTEFVPLSYVNPGFPSGEWLEIQVVSSGQIVWVTAGPQFVSCTVAPSSLPAPASILATPRPTETPTPIPLTPTPTQVVAGLPPDVRNDVPGGACERTDHIKSRIEVNPNFLYRVYARDDRAGSNDGDGIDFVRFTISDNFGQLYQREERVAGYCIFQGGEPTCRLWPFNEQGQYTWGNGGPVVSPGTYQVFIEVVSDEPDPSNNSNSCNWNFDMTVTLP